MFVHEMKESVHMLVANCPGNINHNILSTKLLHLLGLCYNEMKEVHYQCEHGEERLHEEDIIIMA